MSPKNREGRDLEFYKGTIRQLNAENKRLKRRIRQLEREQLFVEYEPKEDVDNVMKSVYDCPKCNRGNFRAFEMSGRSFLVCSYCKDRIKV